MLKDEIIGKKAILTRTGFPGSYVGAELIIVGVDKQTIKTGGNKNFGIRPHSETVVRYQVREQGRNPFWVYPEDIEIASSAPAGYME